MRLPPENRRLLIVDDEPDIRWGYRSYLAPERFEPIRSSHSTGEPQGSETPELQFELVEAESGEKAIQILADERAAGRRFAGAFVDVRMPGRIDGLQFIQEAWKADPDLLVVVATAYQDRSVDEIARLFEDRFQDQWDYLSKPFTSGEIIQKARQLVSSWNRRQRERTYHASLLSQERLAAVGRLARSVGHEFGNVLQPLVSKLDIMKSRLERGQTDGLIAMTEEMIEATTLGSFICRDLLTFGKEADDTSQTSIVELRRPVEGAIRLLQHELKKRDIQVTVEIPGSPRIRCNSPKMVQVFINLLTNSLQASREGGGIRITAEPLAERRKVRIRLADEGCGIPDALKSRVFEPLFTTKGELGNGLGLSSCKQIIEEAGGEITLQSTEGKGTTVELTLPAEGA